MSNFENKTGIRPIEYRILVKPDDVNEKIGGLYRPEINRARESQAQTRGLLVAAGGLAFRDGEGNPWPEHPMPGDRILFNKYAGGYEETGLDGEKYRVITDKDVNAILEGERHGFDA